MAFPIGATASLALQVAVLVLLILALLLKNRKKYRQHGIAMASAVVLHLITVVAVMGPSFRISFSSPGIAFFEAPVIITLIHVASGLVAVTLGIWLVASWHFKTDLKNCFSRKKIMRPTFVLWVASALLGILMYIVFYASTLFS
jgi:uncharacterized membrane protein YozB (DUF420 family)